MPNKLEIFSEADTRAKLIDPAVHKQGWTEDLIRREETAGSIEIISGKAYRRKRGKIDYVLRIKVSFNSQPVAVALIEAKKSNLPPGHGLSQAKGYAACKRLQVPFVFSSNGYRFVEFDQFTGLTSKPKPIAQFPTPTELRYRYEQKMGFKLEDPVASPLLQTYPGGEGTRRYYQDAAIRAVIEKIIHCELNGEPKRALLSLATGAGKTFIAVNLLKRIAEAKQLKRALFVCDRDELRTQALKAFQNVFGSEAAEVYRKSDGNNNAKNARIHIATYQTLGVDSESGDANFLTTYYKENDFSHVIIDECHRSAWGKWSQVLERNKNAVHVGLTATPRQLEIKEKTDEAKTDAGIIADNIKYFGEPVYEYDLAQGIEDGYLAACDIIKESVNLDEKGLSRDEVLKRGPVDVTTGYRITDTDSVQPWYKPNKFEDDIQLPDRVQMMCLDLFNYLLESGGPEQKTLIFCVRDSHADRVASEMNNLYAAWRTAHGKERLDYYAFKCTAESSGNDQLPDFRASSRSHFIATTVDLVSTGVDVPCLRNIVFFRYLNSPISFYQMVGRGTRIDLPTGKLMFRVYDYTNATRLFGEEFLSTLHKKKKKEKIVDPPPPKPSISVEGFDVQVTHAGRFVLADVDGKAMPVSLEDYKQRLAEKLFEEAHTLEDFRQLWIDPPSRQALIDTLVAAGYSPKVVQLVDEREAYDLYDILGELGWGMFPRTRQERAYAFIFKHEAWLNTLPENTRTTIKAIAKQFERGGTEGLENPLIFRTPEVLAAGGLNALRMAGNPKELLRETKMRMFAA